MQALVLCDRPISSRKDKETFPLVHRPYLGPWWNYWSWVTYCRCQAHWLNCFHCHQQQILVQVPQLGLFLISDICPFPVTSFFYPFTLFIFTWLDRPSWQVVPRVCAASPWHDTQHIFVRWSALSSVTLCPTFRPARAKEVMPFQKYITVSDQKYCAVRGRRPVVAQ